MRRSLGWLFVSLLAVVALVGGSAFGASRDVMKTSCASRASSGSQAFRVNVDGLNNSVNEAFDAYFPNDVTVHAGDTVVFDYVGVGEPHTVALGKVGERGGHRDFNALYAGSAERSTRRSPRSRPTRSCPD